MVILLNTVYLRIKTGLQVKYCWLFSAHNLHTQPNSKHNETQYIKLPYFHTAESRNASDIRTKRLLDYMEYSSQFGSIPGVHKFSKNLEATSQSQAPDWW